MNRLDKAKEFAASVTDFNLKQKSKSKERITLGGNKYLKHKLYNGKSDPVALYNDIKEVWKVNDVKAQKRIKESKSKRMTRPMLTEIQKLKLQSILKPIFKPLEAQISQ